MNKQCVPQEDVALTALSPDSGSFAEIVAAKAMVR